MEVQNNESQTKRRPKRKNKNSRFLRNAKGFAKQGIYGRGTHIADDQYSYFINILDAMKAGFEDAEAKVNMANNVFEQTVDQEEHLASNQIVSKALEALVGFVDADNLERFMNAFSKNFRPICSDRFASHVLQKMLEICFLRALGEQKATKMDEDEAQLEEQAPPAKRAKVDNNNPQQPNEIDYNFITEFSKSHRQQCADFVLRVSKFLLNNLEDFVWDACANHITRTAILCLVGVHIPKVAFEKATGVDIANRAKTRFNVPEEWHATMKEFAQRLEMWPQFVDFPYEELTSALTGTICICLRAVDKNMLKHFGRRLLMESFLKSTEEGDKQKIELLDEDEEIKQVEEKQEENEFSKLPAVFQHHCSVLLLETILTVAGRKLFTQLYAMLFATRCATLAQQAQTNFAVQRLLQHVSERTDFEQIFDELQPHLENLLKIGHTGVVSSLSEACLRLGSKQAPLLMSLQKALHVSKDNDTNEDKSQYFFLCLVKLKPYELVVKEVESANTGTTYVHLHGSLLVQNTLKFNKPIFIVNSILSTPSAQLAAVLNTPNGSHIADAFMQSKFVGEKSREKFARYLDGFYVDLAITKFGSRVIEALFNAAQEPQKAYIVKQLADKTNMLRGSPFGRLIYSKLRIETYRLSAAQWRDGLKAKQVKNKAEELFKDIINK